MWPPCNVGIMYNEQISIAVRQTTSWPNSDDQIGENRQQQWVVEKPHQHPSPAGAAAGVAAGVAHAAAAAAGAGAGTHPCGPQHMDTAAA